jgi:predicted dehydrogenase
MIRIKKINTGIIGIGYIGGAHIEAIKRLGYPNIAAVVVRNEAKAKEICENFGIPKYFTNYQGMLADSSIDVIHNCTPNNVHFQINKDVILSGKHILSEKPLTVNSSESQELVKLTQKYNVLNAVNFVYRHYAVVQHIKGMIEKGELGDIYTIHGSYLQDWLLYDTDYNWRIEASLGGPSRAIADIGSHWCDIAQFLVGQDIVEVFADLATFIPVRKKMVSIDPPIYQPINVDTEDYGSVLLKFRNGARGSFTTSQVSAGRKVGLSFEIDGSKASVYWDQESAYTLWIGHRNMPNEVMISHPDLLNEKGKTYNYYQGIKCERWPDAQKNMIDSFYRTILYNEKPKYANFEEAHKIMKVIDSILKSNKSGTWQKIYE